MSTARLTVDGDGSYVTPDRRFTVRTMQDGTWLLVDSVGQPWTVPPGDLVPAGRPTNLRRLPRLRDARDAIAAVRSAEPPTGGDERVAVRCARCRWEGRRIYHPGRAAAPCPHCHSAHGIQRQVVNTTGPGSRWKPWPSGMPAE